MPKIKLIVLCAFGALTQPALAQLPEAATILTEQVFDFDQATRPDGWGSAKSAPKEPESTFLIPAGTATLEIDVTVDHTAKYYIWTRTYSPTGRDNQYFLKVGNEPEKEFYAPTTYAGTNEIPAWQNIFGENDAKVRRGIILPKGTTRLSFRMSEPNLGLDKLIITAQPNFVPAGLGQKVTIEASIPPRSDAVPAWTPPEKGTPSSAAPRLFLPAGFPLKPFIDAEQDRSTPVDLEHEQVKLAWQKLRLSAANQDLKDNCVLQRNAIMANAVYYRLYPEKPETGDRAVKLLDSYLDGCLEYPVDKTTGKLQMPGTRPTGEMILTSALVYDWVIAPQGENKFVAEREKIVRRFLERAAMEIGFPPVQDSIAGHGAEAQLLRDQLSAAIAFYDKYPRIYEIVGRRFFTDHVPVRDYVYASGGFSQGTSYGPYRYQWDMFAAWLFKRMNWAKASDKQDVFAPTQQLQLYYSIYQRRPDGQLMRDGDVYHGSYTDLDRYWTEPMPFMLAASYYQNSRLKREFVRQLTAYRNERGNAAEIFSRTDGDEEGYLWLALFNNRAVKAAPDVDSADQWPSLTRYFGIPLASMIARTDWTKVGDTKNAPVIAYMKAGHTRFDGHQHRDAGHFEIYYKGILASSSGIYSGRAANRTTLQEYNSEHDLNYQKRTVAHNALTLYDAGEKFDQYGSSLVSNDGGQMFDRDKPPVSLDALKSDEYVYGRGIKQRIGLNNDASETRPPFSYLMGDIGKAYSPAKIESYQRAFVFLNLENARVPAALMVFDRVRPTAGVSDGPKWLMHSEEKPDVPNVKGREFTIVSKGGASKLVNRTLYPDSATTNVEEGFVVDGRTYPIYTDRENRSEEQGVHRVEIVPERSGDGYAMLNVMQVIDGGNGALATQALADTTGKMVGALVDNRAVYFAKSGVPLRETIRLELAAGTYNLLVTDLAAGKWLVTTGNVTAEKTVDESHGTIYLPAAPGGKYELTPSAR